MLTTLEREFGQSDEGVALLLDWLVSVDGVVGLEAQLDALRDDRHRHLASGVRARWITRDVASAFQAVADAAVYVARARASSFYELWEALRATRLDLFRLALAAL